MHIGNPKLCKIINPLFKLREIIAELIHIEHHAHHVFRPIPPIPVPVCGSGLRGRGKCLADFLEDYFSEYEADACDCGGSDSDEHME